MLFYLSLPFIYAISILPFWALYRLSDVIFVILYYMIGYRKKVVTTNLTNAFPEKNEEEISKIRRKFYRYFCDLIVETLKTLTISEKSLRKHIHFEDISLFQKYKAENQSVIVVMGHFGNWELAGARFALEPIHQLFVIYHPLKNAQFEKLIVKARKRFGNGLYSMKGALRGMFGDREKLTATAFIADQTPSPDNAYWMEFLNQDTPVFTGTEKLAKKIKYPIVYISVKRPKRGFYTIKPELLFAHPEKTTEQEISQTHTRRLEQNIREQPEIWLWSHRRWKHKRQK
ncbi:MAG: KDO2-lipid IV(A) lauroyltransferase [Paraglaciecola sp.]|jgi:KDO2-lipid IV(A) lauroyltransferase